MNGKSQVTLHIMSEMEVLNICDNKTPKWNFEGKTFLSKCVKVYDGDTATFVFIPYANCNPHKFSCRMLGYNSAELRSKDVLEKEQAKLSRDYLSTLIFNKIVRLECHDNDKYGRILVNVYLQDGTHINQEMLKSGYGKPYHGTGTKLW